jgi:hypothetical protein
MVLGLVTALAALYVWTSGSALPAIVASHFGSSGAANGFMPKRGYLGVMLLIVVLVPLLMTLGMGHALRRPGARINLPNGDYWLAPERRAATIEVLLGYLRGFACALVLFLSYVHGLVVSANQAVPPRLDSTQMLRALGAFLIFVIAWLVLMLRRFRAA